MNPAVVDSVFDRSDREIGGPTNDRSGLVDVARGSAFDGDGRSRAGRWCGLRRRGAEAGFRGVADSHRVIEGHRDSDDAGLAGGCVGDEGRGIVAGATRGVDGIVGSGGGEFDGGEFT